MLVCDRQQGRAPQFRQLAHRKREPPCCGQAGHAVMHRRSTADLDNMSHMLLADNLILTIAWQAEFNALAAALAGENAAFCFCYDEPLSHLIYAACDIICVPSLFEPCGLTQVSLWLHAVTPCWACPMHL